MKYLDKILLFGTSPTYIEHLNLRIRSLNMVALIVSIVASNHIVYDLLVKAWWTAIANCPYVLTSLAILYFNWRNNYRKAFYVTVIGFPIAILTSTLVIGSGYNSEFFLMITACASPLLFRSKKIKNVLFLSNLGLYCGVLVFYQWYPNGLANETFPPLVGTLNGIVIFSLLFIIFNSVFSSNIHYQELILEKNEMISQLNRNLEDKVQQRTTEIQTQAKALQRSNEEIKRFTHITFHDLREPLRNINGFAQLIERKVERQDFENLKEYTQYITWAVRRMDRITKDIAVYAEIQKTELVIASVQLNLLLAQTINQLSPFLVEATPIIMVEELPTLDCNTNQVQLLFENLIRNSVLYRQDRPLFIHIEAVDVGKYWQFKVEDNGIGIASAYHKTVFTMFKRLHNNIKQAGSGIGLALCKKIVENHQGKIWIESKLQEGTSVYFTLGKHKI